MIVQCSAWIVGGPQPCILQPWQAWAMFGVLVAVSLVAVFTLTEKR